MRNTVLSYLLLPLFAGFAFSAGAAPVSATDVPSPAIVAVDSVSVSKALRLDINKADAVALQKQLSGIGKAKAQAIVAYREANGPFASVDELLEIKGIGQALLERNLDKLMVE